MKNILLVALAVLNSDFVIAAEKEAMKVNTEAVEQEALVSISEAKAIEALERIIEKRRGAGEDGSLWERLSELYLKQAKSARFFNLTKTSAKTMSFLPPVISSKSSQKPLNEAVRCFETIKRRFPKYEDMDRVLFHASLTYAQMGRFQMSTMESQELLNRFPKSPWIPDSHLLVGEVHYDQQNFKKALEHFILAAKSGKEKVANYALYKQAWAEYNLRRHEDAINSLEILVKDLDPSKTPNGFALRGEALRDLALFLTESRTPAESYLFFASFTTEQETAEAVLRIASILKSHSKHKDMETLGELYLKKSEYALGKIQIHLLFGDLFRELKKGDKQLASIKMAAELCQLHAPSSEACETTLRTQVTNSAEQWWKEWSKSKSKTSLDYARQALEIEINRNPTVRQQTLEAYAELLYQSEDFDNSARVYQDLAKLSKDPVKTESFAYGRLVSLDRQMAKDPKKVLPREDFKQDTKSFVGKYPKSIHRDELQLKWARLEFEDYNSKESERILREILAKKQKNEILIPAQNQMIETLNKNEKDKELKEMLTSWIDSSPTPERKAELRRLQAKLALEDMENESAKDPEKSLNAHVAFFKKYEDDTKVSDPVLWKTLALALNSKDETLSIDFIEKAGQRFPKDPRVWDSLKQMLLKSSKKNNRVFALGMKYVPQKERAGFLWSYREFMIETKASEIRKIENEIIALNVEPEASLVKVARLEEQLAAGNFKTVFEESKKYVSSKAPNPVRARARLLQAQVLEEEFRTQSVKSSLSKLQTVVAMKLEKMSKAQEAFVSAAQISSETKIAEDAKSGLRRCFEHAITALKNIQVKDSLTAEEKKALDDQIQTLVIPLEAKLKELTPITKVASDSEVHL